VGRRFLIGVLVVAVGFLLAQPVRAACQGPFSAFAVLAALRDGKTPFFGPRDASAPPVPPPPPSLIMAILAVKESDYLAFPLHVAAGWAFERVGCADDAVRDQWRKAAMHAWAPWAAEVAADGLRRTAQPGADPVALVGRDAAEMPWFADNLARVGRALGSG
jgi:hypothetical protein